MSSANTQHRIVSPWLVGEFAQPAESTLKALLHFAIEEHSLAPSAAGGPPLSWGLIGVFDDWYNLQREAPWCMSTAHVAIRSISTQQKDVVTRRLPSGSPWFPRCEIERKQTRPTEIKTVSEVAKKGKHISDDFVFSGYVRALKDAWTGAIADADLIELLYGLIAEPLKLKGQTGQPIGCSKK